MGDRAFPAIVRFYCSDALIDITKARISVKGSMPPVSF